MRISEMLVDTALSGNEFVPILDLSENNLNKRNKRAQLSLFFGQQGAPGAAGSSAYQIWLGLGNTGTTTDFINSLKGPAGQSTYQLWLTQGNVGTAQDFLTSLIGPQGPSGTSGSTIFSGTGNPSDINGINNDYYINTTNGFLFKKAAGTWGQALLVIKGQDGTIFRTGTGVPSSGLGTPNDYYLDISNGNFYGPKTTVWPATPAANIRGPQGIQGIMGTAGTIIYTGTTAPSNGIGVNGDIYINTTNGYFYTKVSGTWSLTSLILKGQDGTLWYTGTGAPDNGVGAINDYYLDVATGDVYGPKSATVWPSTASGNIRGLRGSTIFDGTTDPLDTLGLDDDYYINTSTGFLFSKAAGTWTSTGLSIKGEHGTIWYTGSGVPDNGIGVTYDYYLDSDTGDVYGPKITTVWPATPSANIKGLQGDPGTNGTDGADGTNGLNLSATTVQTGTYAANPYDYVLFDTSTTPGVLNLPIAPPTNTIIGVKNVLGNDLTINSNTGQTFNTATGPTSLSITEPEESLLFIFKSDIWYILSESIPLSSLDSKYETKASSLTNLTVSGSYTPDCSVNKVFYLILTGDTTIENPTGLTTGENVTFILVQDGTGGWTLTLGSKYKTAGGPPALTATPNAIDRLEYTYVLDPANSIDVLIGEFAANAT